MESHNEDYPPEYIQAMTEAVNHAKIYFDMLEQEYGTDMVFNVLQSLLMTYAKNNGIQPVGFRKLMEYTTKRYAGVLREFKQKEGN